METNTYYYIYGKILNLEKKILQEFVSDQLALGQAEQFLLALITRIPEYRLRLEAMLFSVDVAHVKANGTGLEPWIKGAEGN